MKSLLCVQTVLAVFLCWASVEAGQGAIEIAGGQDTVTDIAVVDEQIYWVAKGKLYSKAANSPPVRLGDISDGVSVAGDGKSAFVITLANKLFRLDRDGKKHLLARWKTKSRNYQHVGQVFCHDGFVYWDDEAGGTIRRIPSGGGKLEVLLKYKKENDFIADFALSQSGLFALVYTNYGSQIVRKPFGKSKAEILHKAERSITDLAVSGRFVYFIDTDFGGGSVYRIDIWTKNKRALSKDIPFSLSSLDVGRKHVVFGTLGEGEQLGKIWRLPKRGGRPRMIADSISNSLKILVQGRFAYLYNGYSDENDNILRIALF